MARSGNNKRRLRFQATAMPAVLGFLESVALDVEEFAPGHRRVMNDRGHWLDFWDTGTYTTIGANTYVRDDEDGRGLLEELQKLVDLEREMPDEDDVVGGKGSRKWGVTVSDDEGRSGV